MGWESATFQDKETEVPSLSQDKGTGSKSCQLPGQAGTACENPEEDTAGTGWYKILTVNLIHTL